MPEADFPVAETDKAPVGQFVEQLCAYRAIEDCLHLLLFAEKEGEVEQPELLHIARDGGGGHQAHLDDAALSRRDRRDFRTELPVRITLDLQLAVTLFSGDLRELFDAQPIRTVLRSDLAQLERPVLQVGGAGGCCNNQHGGERAPQHVFIDLPITFSLFNVFTCRLL